MPIDTNVVIMLTAGKADNGKKATLAFSCALASLMMGNTTAMFLTGDATVWGYRGSAEGISVQGFPPLSELIDQFLDASGRLILCSVCYRTCAAGSVEESPLSETRQRSEIGGFATVLELAANGTCITF